MSTALNATMSASNTSIQHSKNAFFLFKENNIINITRNENSRGKNEYKSMALKMIENQ